MAYSAMRSVDKMTISLDPDLRRRLVAESRRTGVAQAELIRDALRAHLRSSRTTLPSFLGAFAVGGDAALDARRYRELWKAELAREA